MQYLFPPILLFLAWFMPLHLLPWMSWHSEMLAFSAVLLLAWQAVFRAAKKSLVARISFFSISTSMIVVLLIWLQVISGNILFFGDAFVFTLYMILCVVSMSLGRASSSNPKTYTALAANVLLGAFLSTIVAFAQVFELWDGAAWINRMPDLRRPGGNMGQPNHLATLLVMGLASLLYLYESNKLGALASALLALTLLTGLAVTESRTGMLSLSLLMLWWFAKRRSLGLRLSLWLVAGGGMGFLALFWYWPSFLGVLMQSGGADAVINTGDSGRWALWSQLMVAVLQRPWWGWGPGQVASAQNAVAHNYASSMPLTYAHNIVLDLAIGIGLPLTALIVVVTSVWLWRRVRSASQLAPWYCLALILPVAVHSMLEFPFAYAYFLVPVMFAVGALEGAMQAKPAFCLGVKPALAILSVTTVLMAWSVVEYVGIEEDFRIVRFEALRIGTTPASYERPHVVLLTQLDALLHGGRIVPRPEMGADELELARKVALRFPWPATQNRYAQSLALNGNPDEAIRQLRVMRALHGEAAYAQIKAGWTVLADEKYPQLHALKLP